MARAVVQLIIILNLITSAVPEEESKTSIQLDRQEKGIDLMSL